VRLPTLRQSLDSRGALDQTHLVIAIPLRDVQAGDFGNRDTIRVSSNDRDLVASTNFSLAGDGKVKTGPPARNKSPHHVIGLKSHPEFVAGKPRLLAEITSSPLVLSVVVSFESSGQLPVRPCSRHTTEKHPVLDERLAKTMHVPGNRNLRDQIQVTVSNQVVHASRKSVIMPLPKTETEHG